MTGHDWKTISKVIKDLENGMEIPKKKLKKTIIDDYKDTLLKLLKKELNALRIHQELLREGFIGSYSTVKKHVAMIKKRDDSFIRIHTEPGEEAQVDFGYLGITKDGRGKKRKTWVFNMRLSCSRLDYYEKAYDQKVETFIRCHINAFEFFGGVPAYVRIDNLKLAILVASFYDPVY